MSPFNSSISQSFAVATTFPKIVTNGLVLNLDVGQQNSYSGIGTSWEDLSGTAGIGILKNGPTYSSANGGSIVFDGIDDYVTVPFSAKFPTGSSQKTLSAFFKVSSISEGREIFGFGANSGSGSRSSLWIDSSNKIGVECQNTSVVTSNWSGINEWTHLCAVLPFGLTTSHSFLIYVNGNLTSSEVVGSDTGLFDATNNACVIGTVPNSTSSHMFVGNIAQVSMYNRALTATEVAQNFNALRGRYGI